MPISSQEKKFNNTKITVSTIENHVVFRINEVNNGVRAILITDKNTGEVLWKINPRNYKTKNIIYGNVEQFFEVSQLPNRVPKQETPKNGKSAPSLKGRLIDVRFEIQYDSFTAASVGHVKAAFQM